MTIDIETSPFAATRWYAGVYTDDQGTNFGFTIVENENVDLSQCGIEEIVWVDETPEDQFEVEIKIMSEFKSVCND